MFRGGLDCAAGWPQVTSVSQKTPWAHRPHHLRSHVDPEKITKRKDAVRLGALLNTPPVMSVEAAR